MGGISLWQLLIVLVIVLLLFGTKKLRNLGGDLGSAFKGFKNAMADKESDKDADFDEADKKEVTDQTKASQKKATVEDSEIEKKPSKSE